MTPVRLKTNMTLKHSRYLNVKTATQRLASEELTAEHTVTDTFRNIFLSALLSRHELSIK